MIQLALARHAKSDWADASVDDHDRPLNDRGRRDAPEVARRVMRTGVRPEVILTSTALRARTTAEHFADVFGADLVDDPALYLATGESILEIARGSGLAEVLVVAHDPGMSELVSALAGREVQMPTAAIAVFTWESGDWDAVGTVPPDDVQLTTP
jgi:phosphohistidine phosphatase